MDSILTFLTRTHLILYLDLSSTSIYILYLFIPLNLWFLRAWGEVHDMSLLGIQYYSLSILYRLQQQEEERTSPPAEPTRHHATSLLYICMHSHLCSHSVIRLLGSLFNKSLISSRYSTPYFRDLGIFSYIAFLILSSQVISFSSFALYLVYGAWRRDVGGGHAPQRTYHSGSHHVNAIQAVERRCTFGPLASKSYSEGPETADLQLKIITF